MRANLVRLCSAGIAALACAGPAHAGKSIDVAEEGGIRDKWMLREGVQLAMPMYPPAFSERKDDVCVSLGYLLKADGTTSDFTLLKAWNSAKGSDSEPAEGYWMAFATAAGDALAQWQFQPRPEVARPTPVFTTGTFVFGPGASSPALRAHCRIPNLRAHLRDLRDNAGRRAPAILNDLSLGDDGRNTSAVPRVSLDGS